MTTVLLDVNLLIALVDPAHALHDAAHVWFAQQGRVSWAPCPITENGLLRIVGNPRYPTAKSPTAICWRWPSPTVGNWPALTGGWCPMRSVAVGMPCC